MKYCQFFFWFFFSCSFYGQKDTVYTSLEAAFLDPSKVYFLDLSGQKIRSIPSSIDVFENLIELNVSKNKLRKLPNTICNLTNLEFLTIDNNKIKKLPYSIGRLGNLIELNLISNKLKSLPKSFGLLIHLTELDFYHNKMRELPDSIANLKALKKLILSEKYFTSEEKEKLKSLLPSCQIIFDRRRTFSIL